MWRASNAAWLVWVCALGTVSAPALAQASAPARDDALEAYLADRDLLGVLAAHLRAKLKTGAAEERVRAAELLGKLYVRQLARATQEEERRPLEEHCRELLKAVPEADSFELRINLAKAEYLQVEEVVERDRLKLTTLEERAEAGRVLRHVAPVFDELAAKAGRRVEQLEKKETLAKDDAVESVRAELGDARRVRSLARYYSGWASYYGVVLGGPSSGAARALEDFGYLLNAVPGKQASLERLPEHLLRFEHVSRAAIGCALCCAVLGRDTEAVRWLDAVENAEGVPPVILDQMFARRMIVNAASQRWADADTELKHRRRDDAGREVPLSIADARLVAVLALQAEKDPALRPSSRAACERLTQIALGDLVKRGEVGHILDIMKLFGASPLGGEGFIVTYVRGLEDFEAARDAHRAQAGNPDQPSTDPALINHYRQAASVLGGALASSDADAFPGELPRAMVREGLAWYYAGDTVKAADRFEAAAAKAGNGPVRRDALWYGIVALDKAIEAGAVSEAARRDRLTTLYLQEYPGTDQAARLLLRQTKAEHISDAQAIDVLLKVPTDSALYEAARRQVARLLYQEFRRSAGTARDFAALRFGEVVEPLMRAEHTKAMAGTGPEALEAANALVLHARQFADAILGASGPDLARLDAAWAMMDAVVAFHGIDRKPFEGELMFRRMQVALVKGDELGAQRILDTLRGKDPKFADAADRLMYRRVLARWKDQPDDVALAGGVVRHGARLLDAAPGGTDATTSGVREAVAAAAATLYRQNKDDAMLQLSVRLDRAQLAAGVRATSSVRRLAEFLEVMGDSAGALSMWQDLLTGLDNASPAWYEARYHSLRLLLALRPAEAAAAMAQHRVLHTAAAPEPWGSKIRELGERIDAAAPPAGGGGKP